MRRGALPPRGVVEEFLHHGEHPLDGLLDDLGHAPVHVVVGPGLQQVARAADRGQRRVEVMDDGSGHGANVLETGRRARSRP